ncbi:SurA N-terminal domain-containing protein [Priestia megaterium]|uniref:SurA N-terminal domain-containing protein n=1 Tax=Priestia megaterium TaxID=1404 RepID=UPI000D511C05|nr:SurA N-terminal domain-containing protein [Priestia megaterium]PVE65932.1 peptidylprolyl isomerase [Priestia megaterium]PVE80106.1 peptidylprolyl isomerase [Priestia megaterium]PVE85282.1 peptidylprolyl isomerase [Priestia megaterium]PVE99375.1 peptidylprolyl isomerase [Priestia megaterium]
MKKLMYTLLIGLIAAALTACGSNDDAKQSKSDDQKTAQTEKQKEAQEKQEKQAKEMQKKLDKQKVDEKKTVAVVNGKKVSGEEYNAALSSSQAQYQQMGQDPTSKEAAKQVKQQTIDNLVGQTLLLQEAENKGYKATDEEVNKKLKETKKQFKTDKQFKAALKDAGLTQSQLKSELADSIKYQQYVDKDIQTPEVTDKEIQDYYDQFAKQSQNQASGGKEQSQMPKLEDVKPQIKQQLEQQKKQEALQKKVEELKKNAKVEVKL